MSGESLNRVGRLWSAAVLAAILLLPALHAPASAAAPERMEAVSAPLWLGEVRSVLDLGRPLEPGEFAWDEAAADGPVRIFVDLDTELLHVFRAGTEIGRARIIYGSEDHPTPTGTFRILQKREDHVSNLYNAPMPYMMRLTWDGVAIHATDVRGRFATHGCIGVPEEFAALLFGEAGIGTGVVVSRVRIPAWHLRLNGGMGGFMGLLSLYHSGPDLAPPDLRRRD
jgi:hypothetical protein